MIKLLSFLIPITLLFNCVGSTSTNQTVDTTSIINDSLPKRPKVSYYDSLFQLYGQPIPDSLLANYLEKDTLELKLDYIVWGCPCPPWVEQSKRSAVYQQKSPKDDVRLYIEATRPSIRLDLSKFNAAGKYYAVVKGVFYKEKRFPKEVLDQWNEEPFPYPAKVFRYFEAKAVRRAGLDTLRIKKD
ncbi:MAG TPA: hypothetical protein DCS93_27100 [Microscillaceae bacterium]|nr:hypothetical protein [Microscillaceae bacterium]